MRVLEYAVCLVLLASILLWEVPSTQLTDGDDVFQEQLRRLAYSVPYKYTVYQNGTTYYAEANQIGLLDDSDSDFAVLMERIVSSDSKIALHDGTFLLTSQWDVANIHNCVLEGSGAATYLSLDDGVDDDLLLIYECSNIALRNMRLDGNKAGQAGTIYTVRVDSSNRVTVENVIVEDGLTDNMAFINSNRIFCRNIWSTAAANVGVIFDTNCHTIELDGLMSWDEPTAFEVHSSQTSVDHVKAVGDTSWVGAVRNGYNNTVSHVTSAAPVNGILVDTLASNCDLDHIILNGVTGDYGIVMRAQGNIGDCQLIGSDAVGSVGVLVEADTVKIHDSIIKHFQSGITTNNDYTTITNNTCTLCTTYGVTLNVGVNYALVHGNELRGNTIHGLAFGGGGAGCRMWNNEGYQTERSGTDTIANGTTSKVVTYSATGFDYVPAAEHIRIIGLETPTTDVGTISISDITATQFTVNVKSDPGASNWDFGWQIIVTPG